jgi:hypothetical protein
MSVFISKNPFKIEIYFKSILNTSGQLTGVIILADGNQPDAKTLTCLVTGRDFDNMSKILENASIINHINGETLVRKSVFYRSIILKFFKSWNLYDENGDMVPINSHIISNMHDTLIRELAKKWLRVTSGKEECQ